MKNLVSLEFQLGFGRSHPIQGELGCLDEAAFRGTIQHTARHALTYADHANSRRRLGEQLGIHRLGRALPRIRRRAMSLEGALSHSAFATPSGERSIWLSGPLSLGRIGVCRAATLPGQPSSRRDEQRRHLG